MKFFHLSDLHIGRNLHHYNLKEDQEYVLNQVIEQAETQKPDVVLISGDIYDKSIPSAEAVNMFDRFLTRLSQLEPSIPVMIISGNHDSGERLDFASGILKHHQIYLSGKVPGSREEFLKKITMQDSWGEVNFYLLPFIKPSYVRHLWEGEENKSYHDSVQEVIDRENIDYEKTRNVLLSHQFYISGGQLPSQSDSETISVGGMDHVDISAVERFDYVALGHLHRAQKVGQEKIRYCGTLLKYSVSEAEHRKSLTVVELGEKGTPPVITQIPIQSLRDVKKKSGTLREILEGALPEESDDFVSILLTDETELFMPREQLENKYNRILEVRLDNRKTREGSFEGDHKEILSDPLLIFREFYKEMREKDLNSEEISLMKDILDGVKEEQI